MGCSPFANFHFQMGVTVMGFAEDSGPSPIKPDFLLSTVTPISGCKVLELLGWQLIEGYPSNLYFCFRI